LKGNSAFDKVEIAHHKKDTSKAGIYSLSFLQSASFNASCNIFFLCSNTNEMWRGIWWAEWIK